MRIEVRGKDGKLKHVRERMRDEKGVKERGPKGDWQPIVSAADRKQALADVKAGNEAGVRAILQKTKNVWLAQEIYPLASPALKRWITLQILGGGA